MRPAQYLGAAVAAATLSGGPSAVAGLLRRTHPIAATREVGRFATGRPSLILGGLAHGCFSTAFAWPAPLLARSRRPVLLGAVYGGALYTVNFKLIAPVVWPEIRAYDDLAQLGDHLAFGAALGWAASRLAND